MKNTVKLELKKAIRNKFFLIAVFIGCVVTTFSALYNMEQHYSETENIRRMESQSATVFNQDPASLNLFNRWVGGEAYSLGSSAFFFIFPLLVAIPYGWSYCAEKKSGYVRNMVIRCGKTNYFAAKYLAVFVSGGLAMLLPLVFNLLLVAMFLPIATPVPYYAMYTGIWASSLMSMLYYSQPFLYLLIYLLIDFIFCGLLACLSFAVTALIKNRVAVVLAPFLVLLAVQYSRRLVIFSASKEISPMAFLHPMPVGKDAAWGVILLEAAVLLVFTLCMTVVRGHKNEIY